MQYERQLGYLPRDVSAEKCGYDIESRIPGTGKLRFLEVKGRIKGAETVTVTKNEILTALNRPDDFLLALVQVDGDAATIHYIARPFQREPDFGVTSVNYKLAALLEKAIFQENHFQEDHRVPGQPQGSRPFNKENVDRKTS